MKSKGTTFILIPTALQLSITVNIIICFGPKMSKNKVLAVGIASKNKHKDCGAISVPSTPTSHKCLQPWCDIPQLFRAVQFWSLGSVSRYLDI